MICLKNERRTLFINPELNPEPSSFQQDLLVIEKMHILIYKTVEKLRIYKIIYKKVIKPQINVNERRFANRVSSFIRALNPVFAPSACFAVRLKYAPQKSAKNAKGGAKNGCS